MVKNTYLLPLVLDIINWISESKDRYLTKLDVCWGYNNVQIKEGLRETSGKPPSKRIGTSLNL